MSWIHELKEKDVLGQDKAVLIGKYPFESIPAKLQLDFLELYQSKSFKLRILGSILGAVFGEAKGCFIFSRRSLEKLLKNDKRITRKALSGSTYSEVWSFLIGGAKPVFQVLRTDKGSQFTAKSTQKGNLIYRGSVLTLVHPELKQLFCNHVGAQLLETQIKLTCNMFDNFGVSPELEGASETLPTKGPIYKKSHNDDNEVDNNDEYDVDFRNSEKYLNSDSFKTSLKPNTDKQGADPSQGEAKGVLAPQTSLKANTGGVSESWGILASDDVGTANAMGLSHQSVMLQRIKALSDSGEVDLTAWEVKFVSECIESIMKFGKILTTKRSEKLLEIWAKAKDAFEFNQICEAETRLIRFCKDRSDLDETAIMLNYIQGFGRSEFDLATRNTDLSTLFAVAKCQRN